MLFAGFQGRGDLRGAGGRTLLASSVQISQSSVLHGPSVPACSPLLDCMNAQTKRMDAEVVWSTAIVRKIPLSNETKKREKVRKVGRNRRQQSLQKLD